MSTDIAKNLAIWEQVDETDPNFTKGFSREGGFKGTATNATYLAKKATSLFGPMGIGWGIKVLNEGLIKSDLTDAQVHRIHGVFWYVWDGQRGEIEHFGQTTFSGTRRSGAYFDEEAPKKSMTDLMSKCLSLLGFAADIHMGLYDDNHYVNDLRQEFKDEDEFTRNRTRNDDPKGDRERAPAEEPKKGGKKKDDKPKETERQDDVDGPEEPKKNDMTDDEFVVVLKKDIDNKKSAKELADYMRHPDTVADLKSLPDDMAKDVRDHATVKLKALGWPKAKTTDETVSKDGEVD